MIKMTVIIHVIVRDTLYVYTAVTCFGPFSCNCLFSFLNFISKILSLRSHGHLMSPPKVYCYTQHTVELTITYKSLSNNLFHSDPVHACATIIEKTVLRKCELIG